MTLYAANVMDIAKPVETKPKKERKRKAKEEPSTPENKEEPSESIPPPAPKKPLSEARMAALEKAKETRKRKREEALAAKAAEEEEIKAKEEEIKAKEEEIARKKEEAKEKRRLKREAKRMANQEPQEETPPTSEVSETPTPSVQEDQPKPKKVRKVKVVRDDSIPPAWFQKYVEGVKQEEAKVSPASVSKKQVTETARQVAQNAWEDGLTRDRVQHEVDNHMSRMYSMIFHNRRFK